MRRVVVTGMGIVSPIGNNLADNYKSLKEGVCGLAPITYFNTERNKVRIAGELKNFNLEEYYSAKDIKRADRFVLLAMCAAKEAITDSGLTEYKDWNKKRTGTIVATGVGGLGTIEAQHSQCIESGPRKIAPYFVPAAISNIATSKIAIEYGLRGSSSCLITACAGGTNAVGESFRMIRDGYQDVMVCGGSESCISEFGIGGFAALNALSTKEDSNRASIPFDKERDGFVMGEGAGILILEELEHAIKRNASIYAEVVGYATNCDAYHVTAPMPDGTGAGDCMLDAISDAGIRAEDITYINAHGTSTKLNDNCETKAIKYAFKNHANSLMISSTKSMTGHLLGASGAVEAIYTVLAVNKQFVPATINYMVPDEECDLDIVANKSRNVNIDYAMSNSLGFGGHNASILIGKY